MTNLFNDLQQMCLIENKVSSFSKTEFAPCEGFGSRRGNYPSHQFLAPCEAFVSAKRRVLPDEKHNCSPAKMREESSNVFARIS